MRVGILICCGVCLFPPGALAQTTECGVEDTVCAVDAIPSGGVNMQQIERFAHQFEAALSLQDWEQVRRLVGQYLSSDDFNPHIGGNIAEEILNQHPLLDLADQVVAKSIEENTVERLAALNPDMGNGTRLRREFGRLYGLRARILWKRDRLSEAADAIEKAMGYAGEAEAGPEDRLLLGLIQYESRMEEVGWHSITQALLMDTQVENRQPEYQAAMAQIVRKRYGAQADPAAVVADYRDAHLGTVPDLSFVALDGSRVVLSQLKGKAVLLNFFSPACGTCRQEIGDLRGLHEAFSSEPGLAFLFVLNRPDLRQEADALLQRIGLRNPTVLVLERGSVYDLIPAEPCMWIADRSGKIVAKHVGYRTGDGVLYRKELAEVIQDE